MNTTLIGVPIVARIVGRIFGRIFGLIVILGLASGCRRAAQRFVGGREGQ